MLRHHLTVLSNLRLHTTGKETIANLDAAATDLISGAALPASMLATDIIGSDVTTLNANGTKTEVVETAYGNSFTNLRSRTTTITSANGLVTTTFIDNTGSGVYEQVDTTTVVPDGSSTEVANFYHGGTQTIDGLTVGASLTASDTTTISADGLVTTATRPGVTDTTVDFANSNGSYEFSASSAGSVAATNGDTNGSVVAFIDANGIDTWSWNNGSEAPGRSRSMWQRQRTSHR